MPENPGRTASQSERRKAVLRGVRDPNGSRWQLVATVAHPLFRSCSIPIGTKARSLKLEQPPRLEIDSFPLLPVRFDRQAVVTHGNGFRLSLPFLEPRRLGRAPPLLADPHRKAADQVPLKDEVD